MTSTEQQVIRENIAKCNYHPDSELAVNNLITIIMNGCYECHAMMYFFKRDDVALFGLADFHEVLANNQYRLCKKLMDYQILRGGRVQYGTIKAPAQESEWNDSITSLECCLNKFKSHNENFTKLFSLADDKNDPHLANFVQHELVNYTNELICLSAKKITKLKRAGNGLGEYSFDRDLAVWLNINFPESIKSQSSTASGQSPVSNVRNIARRVVKELEEVVERFK
jgi:ferritin